MVLPGLDDGAFQTPLPFPFRYWTTDLAMGAMVNVCTNGWIGMDGVPGTQYSGSIPTTAAPNAMIAAHWGDLETRATGICIATVGTAPNRQFVVEWNDAEYLADSMAHLTFEVILSESGGFIDVAYNDTTRALAKIIGIEDQGGINAIGGCPAGATTCVPTVGTRARFTPIP